MEYSMKYPINNKIEWLNMFLFHTSMTDKYPASVTDSVIVFRFLKFHAITAPLIRKKSCNKF